MKRFDLYYKLYMYHPVKKLLSGYINKVYTKKYRIIKKPLERFKPIYSIKAETWESVRMPEVFHVMKSWNCVCFHEAQYILAVPNAVIINNTDFVFVNNECIWDKYYQDNFSKTIPLDYNLFNHDQDFVYLRNKSKIVNIQGNCISLLGVHCTIWAHFITQFLPKLYYAEEAGLLDSEDITVIKPIYQDSHINEIVNGVIERHPKLKVVSCKREDIVSFSCENLFYIPSACRLANHALYESPFDSIVPAKVFEVLNKNLILPYINKIDNTKTYPAKIYLPRRGGYRGLTNYQEIEDFFVKKGFCIVEPHKLSLTEKIAIFQNAELIAGPCSAAWSNVIFCKKAKGLFINVWSRAVDSYSKYLMQFGNVHVLQVTGWDFSSSIHTNFEVPVERIEKALDQLNNE